MCQLILRFKKFSFVFFSTVILLASFSAQAIAPEESRAKYNCGMNTCGFYIDAEYLLVSSRRNNNELQAELREDGFDVEVMGLDSDTSGGSLQVGWRFNRFIGLELGYADFGDFDSRLQIGSDTNFDAFVDAVNREHPAGGNGGFLRASITLPLSETVAISLRPAVLVLDDRDIVIRRVNQQGEVLQTINVADESETVFWGSVGVNWRVWGGLNVSTHLHFIETDQTPLHAAGLGIGYQF